MHIFVDADACPVVRQTEEVAQKYGVPVTLLCDTNHILQSDYSEGRIIGAGADAVDFGFDLSAITVDLLGIKLLWCRGKLPAYYTLIHALLEREPVDGVLEQVVRRQLFASDEFRENNPRDCSR